MRWTQDQGVRGSIPAVLVMFKRFGQDLNSHRLYSPSYNGYQVERKLALCELLQLHKIELQGDETVQE